MSRKAQIRGMEAQEILYKVADGSIPYEEIARTNDRHPVAIANFVRRHRDEIDAIVADHANRLDAIYIGRKEYRLRQKDSRHDMFNDMLSEIEEGEDPDSAAHRMLKIKISKEMDALEHDAAEEMGHLQTRMPNEGPAPGPVGWNIVRQPHGT
jgi:hypothetical protein